jgi:hypothetical protein
MTLTSVTASKTLTHPANLQQGLYQTVHQAKLSNLQAETETLLSQLQVLKQTKGIEADIEAIACQN